MTDDPLRLTVLGSAAPYPTVDNACSGYLITSGNTRVWVDAGSGTLGQLQRYVRLDELDAIWISHLHADHCSDLLTAYYGVRYGPVPVAAPIPLFGPPGIAERLALFLANSSAPGSIEQAFAIQELTDGHEARLGPLTLTSREMTHGLPAFALRAEAGGRALVYSGDTVPCANLTAMAEDCDLLLCEAGIAQPPTESGPAHCTPEDAGATAAAAGVGRLVVTHVDLALTPEQAVARAATEYDGPIDYAAPEDYVLDRLSLVVKIVDGLCDS